MPDDDPFSTDADEFVPSLLSSIPRRVRGLRDHRRGPISASRGAPHRGGAHGIGIGESNSNSNASATDDHALWRALVAARASPFAVPGAVGGYDFSPDAATPAAGASHGAAATPDELPKSLAEHWLSLVPPDAAAAAAATASVWIGQFAGEMACLRVPGGCSDGAASGEPAACPTSTSATAVAGASSGSHRGRWDDRLVSLDLDRCPPSLLPHPILPDPALPFHVKTGPKVASHPPHHRHPRAACLPALCRCAFPAYRRGTRRGILAALARTILSTPPAATPAATATTTADADAPTNAPADTPTAAAPPLSLGYKQGLLSLLAVVTEAAFFRTARKDVPWPAPDDANDDAPDSAAASATGNADADVDAVVASPAAAAAALRLACVLFALFPALAAYYHPDGTADTLDRGVFPHALRLVRFWAPEVCARVSASCTGRGNPTILHPPFTLHSPPPRSPYLHRSVAYMYM